MDMHTLDAYIHEHLEDALDELMAYCRIPSVFHNLEALQEAATWLEDAFRRRGFQVFRYEHPSGVAPVIWAERRGRRSDRVLLIYNHYDVQPPDPLDEWDHPPFEPTRRGNFLFARGVSDDKGHLISRLLAVDAWLAVHGDLPCTVRFVVEGEEEGRKSETLRAMMEEHRDRFQAQGCIWEFGGVGEDDVPLQHLGMRGIAYFELEVQALKRDVHSGIGGSFLPNAAWRLVWALNSIKTPDERVHIPGFYDDVQPPSPRDLELLAQMPHRFRDFADLLEPPQTFLKGETDPVALYRMAVFEPSCTITGLQAGYQGPGAKTVLPARAKAKLEFRLVPWQKPEDIAEKLRRHLKEQGFEDVQVHFLGGLYPMKMDPDHPFVNLVVETAREVYGRPMVKVPMVGPSGPAYWFVHHLGLPTATAGIAYPGSRIHAPNENIRIDLFEKGARHMARIFHAFAQAG